MEKGRRSLAAAPFVFQLLDIRLVFIQIEAKQLRLVFLVVAYYEGLGDLAAFNQIGRAHV